MTEDGSAGIVQLKTFRFADPPDEMELDCGSKLGPVTMAYETYGELNSGKSNAVLILHALTGDAHAAGFNKPDDPAPGWWDAMIGPGKAFDTNKYFVICSNVLGGCRGSTGPSTINPATGKPYALSFPLVTIGDMAHAQCRLLEHLGIETLLCVAGGSMGGMQVLEWITRYPEKVHSAICIAAAPHNNAQAIAFNTVGRHSIQADTAFQNGNYQEGGEGPAQGLSIARMLGHITYLSDETMREKFGRALRSASEYSYDFESEFSVETYLDHQGEKFVGRFDANSYLYMTKACDYFDMTTTYGTLDSAFARVQSRVLILSFTSDWLYPAYQSQEMTESLMRNRKDVSYCNIQSNYGHDAFLLEVDVLQRLLGGFIKHSRPEEKCQIEKTPDIQDKANTRQAPLSPNSIYDGPRVDYDLIVDLIRPGSRVLDIGCGDGELLTRLAQQKQIDGTGIELDERNIIRCVERGISVIQADIDKGLSAIPSQSYDYVTLSMTLQVIKEPEFAIREMLRVGKKCIISFPNFAYWKIRAILALTGKAPITRNLPYSWYSTPNRSVLSVKDFRQFCDNHNIRIEQEIPLTSSGSGRAARMFPNLFADEAVYVVSAQNVKKKQSTF